MVVTISHSPFLAETEYSRIRTESQLLFFDASDLIRVAGCCKASVDAVNKLLESTVEISSKVPGPGERHVHAHVTISTPGKASNSHWDGAK